MKKDIVFNQPASNGALAPECDTIILRRVNRLDQFPLAADPRPPFMAVALVDCETTGLSHETDEIIDLAVVLLEIDAYGRVVQILGSAQSLRRPVEATISAKISRLTGITPADVADVHFDPAPFEQLLGAADVSIAHNAAFDLPFIERLMPQLAGMPWACSMKEFDWLEGGFDGCKLGHLLMQIGRFNAGHRAMADVVSLLHVLTYEPAGVGTILADIVKMAQAPTVAIEATGAHFDMREVLKSAGYRWNPDKRVWWQEVSGDLAPGEIDWLRSSVIPARYVPRTYSVTWKTRHR
ncbi:DNA polymerase III subunit epsilon [Novosphingobium umbonatum]|uniref:DNA polymerase III subunit epsilon n=1 Tax=Novosphingobium umbonatum TaxID=1908524 RepID=A0A3S2X2H8_9SPHN|nr:3'-5' exonuclease [Novosphingobium umbonatum]RVU04037.1 DNA polymerase III subunit epsilon [Novosphingobium umbonatum]